MQSTHHNQKNKLLCWLKNNRHVYWTLALIVILLAYFLPELLVTDHYFPTQTQIDSYIPFVPAFVIFYLLWFPCLFCTGIWLLVKDGEGYRQYMCFLLLAYVLAAVIYLCWPNGQDLRPTLDAPNGVFEKILAGLYAMDTNTNVLPSLHVVGSIGYCGAVLRTKTIRRKWIKVGSCILAVLISISTVFVKQHAVLDLVAGAVVGLALFAVVTALFRRRAARCK